MGGQKIEMTKEAAKAPLALLKDTDSFGVVAFDYNFYWPVKFQTVANRSAITQSISTIIAGGETNIYPALREAYIQLAGADTQVKHVILLSDGRSLPDDFEGLTKKMAEAKITVSTVAVGNGADRELLSQIAEWGHGRTYYLEDPTAVPQIFTEETELATGKTLREESFKPVVKKNVEAFKGIDFNTRRRCWVTSRQNPRTRRKYCWNPSARIPILARWQYGLGKTAAFLSDLKDRWAVEWLTLERISEILVAARPRNDAPARQQRIRFPRRQRRKRSKDLDQCDPEGRPVPEQARTPGSCDRARSERVSDVHDPSGRTRRIRSQISADEEGRLLLPRRR